MKPLSRCFLLVVVLWFVIVLFTHCGKGNRAESVEVKGNSASGFLEVADQKVQISRVHAFLQQCVHENSDPNAMDIVVLLSDVDPPENALTEDRIGRITAFNSVELIRLAAAGKFRGVTATIGHKAQGKSDKMLEIHQPNSIFHPVFGEASVVLTAKDMKFEGTAIGNQISGIISSEGRLGGEGYQYEIQFSAIAKDLPKPRS